LLLKVTIINSDFRVYWKSRLKFLHHYLKQNQISINAIELFGRGSPYDFDPYSTEFEWLTCLFPDQDPAKLSVTEIEGALFKRLDEENPDIVIGASIVFYAGALGLRWAKKRGKKFITFDDIRPWQVKRNIAVQWVKNRIMKQCDAMWVPDEKYKAEYSQLIGKNMFCINGLDCVDNAHFTPKQDRQPDNNSILCVARFVPVKNLENLLRAWQLIEHNNSTTKLVLVGEGPLYGDITALAEQLNLKQVEFVGQVTNDDIPAYYDKADALILPSLSETWGLVVNEAMAAGLPMLLSNKVNAATCLLQDGVNGFGFEPDIDGIVHAVEKFISLGKHEKQMMSAASLQIIKTIDYGAMGGYMVKGLAKLNTMPFKRIDLVTKLIINNWHGKYSTLGWM
jgi:glycosyltransferase involved in cell wall biosynthesis